ncbi:MAG: hypothetical protein KUL75_03300, partial [Sterolibacterium sp.]|nr:hypothetical protein [Sterolibacterium sp.]
SRSWLRVSNIGKVRRATVATGIAGRMGFPWIAEFLWPAARQWNTCAGRVVWNVWKHRSV